MRGWRNLIVARAHRSPYGWGLNMKWGLVYVEIWVGHNANILMTRLITMLHVVTKLPRREQILISKANWTQDDKHKDLNNFHFVEAQSYRGRSPLFEHFRGYLIECQMTYEYRCRSGFRLTNVQVPKKQGLARANEKGRSYSRPLFL